MLLDYFDRVYVINLPHQTARRRRVEDNLLRTGLANPSDIKWVRAISGAYCPPPLWFEAGGGAWGCLRSHQRIAEDATMDGLQNYCVLEDDVIFHDRASNALKLLMEQVPDDWGQIYLGGQHLKEPESIDEGSFVVRCRNVTRTHAFGVHNRIYPQFYQKINEVTDFIKRGSWHIDHQLGLAHEENQWNTYAPRCWIAGQEEGVSNISDKVNPQMWWHYRSQQDPLPFIFLTEEANLVEPDERYSQIYFGSNLKQNSSADKSLDECVDSPEDLRNWMNSVSEEALKRGLLPGIYHPLLSQAVVQTTWAGAVIPFLQADLSVLVQYPFESLT